MHSHTLNIAHTRASSVSRTNKNPGLINSQFYCHQIVIYNS